MHSISTTATGTRVRFDFTWRRFRIAIADDPAAVRAAQALRWSVFRHEWQGQAQPVGLDSDPFDERADHLLLYDRGSDRLVGTYRFIRGQQASDFYSSTEFHIDSVIRYSGEKVELGRACLLCEWRNNLSVVGLYQGICAYIAASGARWLFGCSSIDSTDPADAAALSAWFTAHGHHYADPRLRPARPQAWRVGPCMETVTPAQERRVQDLLPPLLRTYLRAGARVVPTPVLDPEFACMDFLTLFDLRRANRAFLARYTGTVAGV